MKKKKKETIFSQINIEKIIKFIKQKKDVRKK